jgi:gas vesicle protein
MAKTTTATMRMVIEDKLFDIEQIADRVQGLGESSQETRDAISEELKMRTAEIQDAICKALGF